MWTFALRHPGIDRALTFGSFPLQRPVTHGFLRFTDSYARYELALPIDTPGTSVMSKSLSALRAPAIALPQGRRLFVGFSTLTHPDGAITGSYCFAKGFVNLKVYPHHLANHSYVNYFRGTVLPGVPSEP